MALGHTETSARAFVWHLATLKQVPVLLYGTWPHWNKCPCFVSAVALHVFRKWRGRPLFPVELGICVYASACPVRLWLIRSIGGEVGAVGASRADVKNGWSLMCTPSWRNFELRGTEPEPRREWLWSESFSQTRNTFWSLLAANGEDPIIAIPEDILWSTTGQRRGTR